MVRANGKGKSRATASQPPPREPISSDDESYDGEDTIHVESSLVPESQYPPLPASSPDPFIATTDTQPSSSRREPTKPVSTKRAKKQPKKHQDNRVQKIRRLIWSFEIEQALCGKLVDQVRLGKRADNGYKSEAWEVAYQAVLSEYTRDLALIDLEKLKSKLSNFQALYKD
jgi:hypothetical protein